MRPKLTHGVTLRINTGCGRMYVTLNEDNQGLCELFTQLGKSGGCTASQSEAVSRLISLALRSGINYDDIVSQLKGIRCPTPMLSEGNSVLSCADGIAKAMETFFREKSAPDLFIAGVSGIRKGQAVAATADAADMQADSGESKSVTNRDFIGSCPQCPECGEMLEFKEGCASCTVCGYSKCW